MGFILNKTNTKFKNELHHILKPFNVTPEQWAVLNRLWERNYLTPKELTESLYKDFPNILRILDKLEKKELIFKKENPQDKRSSLICLTEKGRNLKDILIPPVEIMLAKASKGINKHQQQVLKKLLKKIYANIE